MSLLRRGGIIGGRIENNYHTYPEAKNAFRQ